jgi:predicted XRE-type DNA-binding protein
MTEIWKSIEGYEDTYEVSNLGRVKSLTRVIEKFLNPNIVKGYLQVGLFNGSGVQKKYLVHRLVAKAFLGNLEQKPHVNHKDGVKSNNLFSNLEWCTASENVQHAYDNGLAKGKLGEKSHLSKLTEIEAKKIKNLLAKKTLTHLQISKLFGVSKSAISHISAGNNWSKI